MFDESNKAVVLTARILDTLLHYQHGSRFAGFGAGHKKAASKSEEFCKAAHTDLRYESCKPF